jgi:hypothetical protein
MPHCKILTGCHPAGMDASVGQTIVCVMHSLPCRSLCWSHKFVKRGNQHQIFFFLLTVLQLPLNYGRCGCFRRAFLDSRRSVLNEGSPSSGARRLCNRWRRWPLLQEGKPRGRRLACTAESELAGEFRGVRLRFGIKFWVGEPAEPYALAFCEGDALSEFFFESVPTILVVMRPH